MLALFALWVVVTFLDIPGKILDVDRVKRAILTVHRAGQLNITEGEW